MKYADHESRVLLIVFCALFLIAIFVIIRWHLDIAEGMIAFGVAIFLCLAWHSNVMDDGPKAWQIMGAVALATFGVLTHNMDDLRLCVEQRIAPSQCHTVMHDFDRDSSP